MGFFSTKRRTVVGVTTVPLIKEIPSLLKQGTLTSILGNTPLAETLQSTISNGFQTKARSLYYYGQSDYYYGLPEGYVSGYFSNVNAVKNIILSLTGREIEIVNLTVDKQDPAFIAYGFLVNSFGMNLASFELSNPPEEFGLLLNKPVFFNKAVKMLDSNTGLILYFLDEDNNQYTWDYFPEEELNTVDEFVQLTYSYTETNETKYDFWYYNTSLNTYPDLNNQVNNEGVPYYPVIPIRQRKENIVDSTDEEKKKSVTRAMRIVGSNLEKVTEAVMSEEEGNEPDKIDDIFVIFALNVHTKIKESNEYLFEYFKYLETVSVYQEAGFTTWLEEQNQVSPYYNELKIQEDTFDTLIRYNWITVKNLEGVVGKVGEVIKSYTFNDPHVKVRNNVIFVQQENDSLILKKQVTETSYTEIEINGLVHISTAKDGIQAVVTLKESYLAEEEGEDATNKGMYLPLDKRIVDRFSMLKQHTICSDGLNLIVYTSDVIKIKWYQKTIVGDLLKLAAIIVAVVTVGSASSISNALYILAVNFAVSVVLTVLLKFAISIVGEDIALILAVVAVVAAVIGGYGTEAVLPWAQDLMFLATQTFNALSQIARDTFLKLSSEYENFIKDAKELQEELKAFEDSLGNGSPDYLIEITTRALLFNSNETPDQFFNRTIHEKNPGVKSFEALSSFVDRMLKLPETNAYV